MLDISEYYDLDYPFIRFNDHENTGWIRSYNLDATVYYLGIPSVLNSSFKRPVWYTYDKNNIRNRSTSIISGEDVFKMLPKEFQNQLVFHIDLFKW